MKFFRLPNSDNKISKLGLGFIGYNREIKNFLYHKKKNLKIINTALDLSVNFIDTADTYENGFAEILLSEITAKRRSELFISTKFSPLNNTYKDIIEAANNSLKRLKIDKIDLYQIHWYNNSISLNETLDALSFLLDKKKIRYVGLSNFNLSQINKAIKIFYPNNILSIQNKMNLFVDQSKFDKNYFNNLEEQNIINIAYGVFLQKNYVLNKNQNKLLNTISKKYNINYKQVFLLWACSHHNTLVLTRTSKLKNLLANIKSSNIQLSENEIVDLNKLFAKKIEYIPVDRIKILNTDADSTHKIYTTLKEALSNPFKLKPDINDLEKEIKEFKFKPVELIKKKNVYYLFQGRMRFWTWIYINSYDSKIPAIVY